MKLTHIISLTLVLGAVAYALYQKPPHISIYSDGEVDAAKKTALQSANDGNTAEALLRLKTLLKYAPNNQPLWMDYLTVLHWDGQNKLAISLLDNVDLSKSPDYFLSAMFNAARNSRSWVELLEISPYDIVFKNTGNVDQKYWETVDELFASGEQSHASLLLQEIQKTPDLSSQDLYFLIKKHQLLSSQEPVKALTLALQQRPDGQKLLHQLWLDEQDVLIQTQHTEQARSNINQQLKRQPNDKEAQARLIAIQQQAIVQSKQDKKWSQALTQQERLIRMQNTPYNFKQWADINKQIRPRKKQLTNYQNLLWKYPKNQWLIGDTIAALSQQGLYTKATKLTPRLKVELAPSYVLEHAAFSARKTQNPERALVLYEAGMQRFPNNLQFHLGKALSLIDQQKNTQANKILIALSKSHPHHTGVREALILNYTEQGKRIQELLQHQKVLAQNPRNAASYRKVAMLTLGMGSTEMAFDLSASKPELFSKQDWKQLYADRAAIAIRWANLHERDITIYRSRIATAEKYLNDYQHYLQRQLPSDQHAAFNVQNDRLLILSLKQEHTAVVELYTNLQDSRLDIPADSQRLAAKSYLALKQPRKSLAILDTLSSNNNKVLSQKYYAHLDANEPEKALAIAEKQKSINPIWLAHKQSKFLDSNSNRLRIDINNKLYPTYMNRLEESQQKLESFLRMGPANTELRNHLATVYRWRGWPRQSQRQIAFIQVSEPDYLSAKVNSIYNDIAMYKYENIDRDISELEKNHYRSRQVEILREEWELEKMASIEITASASHSSGSRFSSRDKSIESQLTSALLRRHLRLFARALYATNNQVQSGSFKRIGLGVQWRSHDLELSSELSQSMSGGNSGIGFAASWLKNDRWTLSAELQSYSDQTPLRAFEQDIKMSSYAIDINYAKHESRENNLRLSFGDFSDGNQRLQMNLSHRIALHRSDNHLLDGRLALGWQSNNKDNTSYFNPSALTTLSTGLDYTGTLHRHYSEYFKHRASLDLALQSQADFGQGVTWGVSYAHLWQRNKRLNGSYGIGYSTPIFDGGRENSFSYFARLRWKF